jgi:hypothetical protein
MNITPITPAVSLGDYVEFVDYVCRFYESPAGIYSPQFTTDPVSRNEIAKAVIVLLEKLDDKGIEFQGDSVDREAVRDILIADRHKKYS